MRPRCRTCKHSQCQLRSPYHLAPFSALSRLCLRAQSTDEPPSLDTDGLARALPGLPSLRHLHVESSTLSPSLLGALWHLVFSDPLSAATLAASLQTLASVSAPLTLLAVGPGLRPGPLPAAAHLGARARGARSGRAGGRALACITACAVAPGAVAHDAASRRASNSGDGPHAMRRGARPAWQPLARRRWSRSRRDRARFGRPYRRSAHLNIRDHLQQPGDVLHEPPASARRSAACHA